MEHKIEWQEPPPRRRNEEKGRWYSTFAALRERPNEWARVGKAHQSTASLIPAGKLGGAKPGEFEATSRNFDGKLADIYVRYVGGESA